MAPFCAAVEIILVNYEIWCSPIPQYNAVLVSIVSVALFPCWYLLFFLLILAHLYQLDATRISRHTKLVIYAPTPKDANLSTFLFLVYLPLRFVHFIDGLVSAAYAYQSSANTGATNTGGAANADIASTTTIISKSYSNLRIVFFIVTSPIWVVCVCVVRVLAFIGLGNLGKSDHLLSGHGGGHSSAGLGVAAGGNYDAKNFSMPGKDNDTDDNNTTANNHNNNTNNTTTNKNDVLYYPTSNYLPSGGGGGGASTGGIMSLTFHRLTVSDAKIGFLGRKPNVVVRVTYGE